MSRSMQLLKTSKQLLTLMKVNLKDKMADFSKRPNVINRAYDYYEDLIGVKEVRMSQQKVLVAESEFAKSSKQRREIQAMLTGIQEQLKQIRQKLGMVFFSSIIIVMPQLIIISFCRPDA